MNPIILYNGYISNNDISVTTLTNQSIGNVIDGNVHSSWESGDTSSYIMRLEFESSREVDSLLIGNHNLGTKSAEVEVYKYENPNEILSKLIYNDNTTLFKMPAPSTYHKFDIEVDSDNDNHKIGFLYLGKSIEFPYPPDAPLLPFSEGISPKFEIPQSGNLLSSEKRFNPISISHSFSNISKQWIDDNYMPFWNNWAKRGMPFVYAWDLDNRPDDIFKVWFSGEHIHALPVTHSNYVENLTLNMTGIR